MVDLANRNNLLARKLPVLFFALLFFWQEFDQGTLWSASIEQLSRAAIQGDTTAQINLGHQVLPWAREYPKDIKRSRTKWYRMAAEQGQCQGSISSLAFHDTSLAIGVLEVIWREGVKWYQKAAEQG